MSRYPACFQRLAEAQEGAFVPFLVVGDPDPETSLALMHACVDAGADMLELGIPFSDPLADGPTIQAAMQRALDAGMNPATSLDLIKTFRETDDETPIGLLIYANIPWAMGLDSFFERCARAGVDSALIADAPLNEVQPFAEAAAASQIDCVLICPPQATPGEIAQIAATGKGYTYVLSRAGVTGADIAAGRPVRELLHNLDVAGAPPAVVGFGISQPEQVRENILSGAKGVITGSAIVQRIGDNLGHPKHMIEHVSALVSSLKSATRSG